MNEWAGDMYKINDILREDGTNSDAQFKERLEEIVDIFDEAPEHFQNEKPLQDWFKDTGGKLKEKIDETQNPDDLMKAVNPVWQEEYGYFQISVTEETPNPSGKIQTY